MAQRALPLVRTADDLALLPGDGNRYELIDGVLFVTPAPRVVHQLAQMALIRVLLPYADALGLTLLAAPTAVRASLWTEVQPDLLVLSALPDDHGTALYVVMPTLALAVEIISPSTASRDRSLKRTTYLRYGVAEYWVVDIDARTVDVWQTEEGSATTCRTALRWQPTPEHSPLVIDLHEYFAQVDGGT